MLYYCGFDTFLKFRHKTGKNNIFLRPLSDLCLHSSNDDKVIQAFIGWCSLFLQTGNGQVVYLGFTSAMQSQQQLTASTLSLNRPLLGSDTSGQTGGGGLAEDTDMIRVCAPETSQMYVVNIECGSKHTLLLTLDLQLFKWTGFNFEDSPPVPLVLKAEHTEEEDRDEERIRVSEVSVGLEFSAILTESGNAFLLDLNESRVVRRLTDRKCAQVSCGQEHVLLLTADQSGRVLSYGRGSRGQLGHGTVEHVLDTTGAQLVDALDGIRMKAVSAGGWHSMALSQDGDVYVWGWNESGQLGYSREALQMKALPLPLEISEDDRFVQISCGSRHSMAISENGLLFGWGWNKWGQLGLNPREAQVIDSPQVIPTDEKVSNICCKFWSTLIETQKEN